MKFPRLVHFAGAFACGVWLAHAAGPLSRAPAPWVWFAVASALLVAGVRSKVARIGLVLAAAAALGGATEAWHAGAVANLLQLPVGAAVDDRVEDSLEGTVRGPVVDAQRSRRFILELDAPAAGAVEVTVRGRPDILPGDRARVIGRLRTPRGYRVPGAVDRRALAHRRGAQWLLSADSAAIVVIGREPSAWRGPGRAQRWAAARIAARGGDIEGRAVVRAMVAGDRGAVAPSLAERFRAAGIAHVLAVSGLHMAATALLLFVAVRRLWASIPALALRVDSIRAAELVAAPAAVAYAAMTGARPSTMRALVVVLCVLAAAALRRRPRLLDALAVAALLLLVASPAALFDPGVQLSFVATATLAIVAVSGRWLWSMLRATLWVTLATAPIAAFVFGAVPTGGILANLVAIPVAELVILPLGLAGLVLTALSETAGGVLHDLAVVAASALDTAAGWIADVFPVLRVAPLTGLELGAAVAVVVLLVIRSRRAAVLAVVPALVLVISYLAPRAPDGVVVTFLDVGQGDAAVVELPDGEVWLIDAGGLPFVSDDEPDPARARASPGEYSVARFLAHRRIRRVDVVVCSHPHPDHVAGLSAIADVVDVGEVWTARGTDYYGALDGERVVHPPLGTARERNGVTMEVLAPRYLSSFASADPVSGVNDNSLVVRVRFAGRAILFPGDIEAEGEELLLAGAPALAADVVKVPHHGSPTSSSEAFVRATGARWAVVSCGRANRFGFPSLAVTRRWQRAGATVLRTDQRGAVTVRIRPSGELTVETFACRRTRKARSLPC